MSSGMSQSSRLAAVAGTSHGPVSKQPNLPWVHNLSTGRREAAISANVLAGVSTRGYGGRANLLRAWIEAGQASIAHESALSE